MSGYAWNQANPVENFYELRRNIDTTKKKMEEVNVQSMLILADLATHPVLSPLVQANIQLLIQYFSLQIQFNNLLDQNLGQKIPVLGTYYRVVIQLNQQLMDYFTELLSVIQQGDRDQLVAWIEKKKGTNMLSLMDMIKSVMIDATIDYLDHLKAVLKGEQNLYDYSSIVGNVNILEEGKKLIQGIDIQKIKDDALHGLKSGLKQLEVQKAKDLLTGLNTELKGKVQDIQKKIADYGKLPVQKGGRVGVFNRIYNPVSGMWIETSTGQGLWVLNKFLHNYIR